jgi:hypothetical protein
LCDTSIALLTPPKVATPTRLHNFSTALLNSTKITESTAVALRSVQPFPPRAIYPAGEINASPFELVMRAHDPRIMEIGAKFLF